MTTSKPSPYPRSLVCPVGPSSQRVVSVHYPTPPVSSRDGEVGGTTSRLPFRLLPCYVNEPARRLHSFGEKCFSWRSRAPNPITPSLQPVVCPNSTPIDKISGMIAASGCGPHSHDVLLLTARSPRRRTCRPTPRGARRLARSMCGHPADSCQAVLGNQKHKRCGPPPLEKLIHLACIPMPPHRPSEWKVP
jgi:hypothetical protein